MWKKLKEQLILCNLAVMVALLLFSLIIGKCSALTDQYRGYDDYDFGIGGISGGAGIFQGPFGGTTYLEGIRGGGIGGSFGSPVSGLAEGALQGAYYNPYTGMAAAGGIGGVVGGRYDPYGGRYDNYNTFGRGYDLYNGRGNGIGMGGIAGIGGYEMYGPRRWVGIAGGRIGGFRGPRGGGFGGIGGARGYYPSYYPKKYNRKRYYY